MLDMQHITFQSLLQSHSSGKFLSLTFLKVEPHLPQQLTSLNLKITINAKLNISLAELF